MVETRNRTKTGDGGKGLDPIPEAEDVEAVAGAEVVAAGADEAAVINLTERPSSESIVNQIFQITRDYNCSPHLPLWMKFIKSNGFLTPIWGRGLGVSCRGCSVQDSHRFQRIRINCVP